MAAIINYDVWIKYTILNSLYVLMLSTQEPSDSLNAYIDKIKTLWAAMLLHSQMHSLMMNEIFLRLDH